MSPASACTAMRDGTSAGPRGAPAKFGGRHRRPRGARPKPPSMGAEMTLLDKHFRRLSDGSVVSRKGTSRKVGRPLPRNGCFSTKWILFISGVKSVGTDRATEIEKDTMRFSVSDG